MTEPTDTPGAKPPEDETAGSGGAERWGKWERWRSGELQLPNPDVVLGEQGLGEPGEPMRVPWRGRDGIAVFLIHLLVAALLTTPVAFAVRDQDTVTAIAILFTEAALLITTLLWVRLKYRVGARALGFRGWTRSNVGLGVAVGAGGLLAATVVGGILTTIIERATGDPAPEPNQISLVDEPEGAILWIIGISVVLLAPLAEEAFFRGLVYGGLRRWARVWPAALWAGAVFAVAHIQPIVMLPIFVLGLALSWVVERTRSLVPAIVAHLVFNLFGFVALFIV